MDTHIHSILRELELSGRENDQCEQDRDKKMLNLEPETAQLVNILVRSGRRTRQLEIGTSNGYSTIWLAEVTRDLDGRVTSIDCNADKLAMADQNLQRAGLRDVVELVHGDAIEVVASLPGPFDFVLLDGDRLSYPAQLELLLPKLTSEAMLLTDNVLSHRGEIEAYLGAIRKLPDFDELTDAIGKGLHIALRRIGAIDCENLPRYGTANFPKKDWSM